MMVFWFLVLEIGVFSLALYAFLRSIKHAWAAGYCQGRADEIMKRPPPKFIGDPK